MTGQNDDGNKREIFKFDIFKGERAPDGRIVKVHSMGTASLAEGSATYHLHLKALLKDNFYLLPQGRDESQLGYAILTREDSLNGKRKFFWHRVGEAKVLDGHNHGLMALTWDLFPNAEIFMSLYPLARKQGATRHLIAG